MGRLVYSAITSLDGFIEDEEGSFGWAVPDEEVHSFINELERPFGTYFYGRLLYEMMVGWETEPPGPEQSDAMRDFAHLWQAAEKIVYSTTLERVVTARTRLERVFDPEAVRRLKAERDHDLVVGGSALAAHFFAAGLVDEVQLFLAPTAVGRGKPAFPTRVRLDLDLREERRFDGGMVYLRYGVAGVRADPSDRP